MVQFIKSACILLCSLQVLNCSVQPVVSDNATTVGSTLAVGPVGSTAKPPTTRKPISIVDTLIVHLINSQPSTSSVNHHSPHHHHKSQFESHSHSNSLQEFNSSANTSETSSPALTCTDGQTYWDPMAGQCVKCTSSCPAGAYVSRVCNRTHDLECLCHKGSYMDKSKTCKPCAECPYGWGVWRTCRWSRNTVCRKCQPGTYSGAHVGTLGCVPCSKCGPSQEVIAECDGNRDTVCVDRAALRANFSHYFPELTERRGLASSSLINADDLIEEDIIGRDRGSSYQVTNYASKPGHQNALPVYFAVLVVVVFGLCIYALIQLRCNEAMNGRAAMLPTQADHKQQLMLSNPGTAVMIPQVTTIATSPYYQPACLPMSSPGHHHGLWPGELAQPRQQQQQTHFGTVMHLYTSQRCSKVPSRAELTFSDMTVARNVNGGSGGKKIGTKYKAYYELLYAPNDAPVQAATHSDCQELTTEVVEELTRKLADDSNSWRMLAQELGYDDKQIEALERRSTGTETCGGVVVDTAKVIRLLLTDWRRRKALARQGSEQTEEDAASNMWPVVALVRALRRIDREDCARLVQQPKQPSSTSSSCASSSSPAI